MIHHFLSETELKNRLKSVHCILLDWDGVFNDGFKNSQGSSFSETDSMGLNLLRFAFYLQNGKIPHVALISGEKNPASFFYAKREHLDSCYFKIKDKRIALEHLQNSLDVGAEHVVYFFDDILDLPVARRVGLRSYIHHPSREKFFDYLKSEKLADISSDLGGGDHALRELSEYLMVCMGLWNPVLISREHYDERYSAYIRERNSVSTKFYSLNNDVIVESFPEN